MTKDKGPRTNRVLRARAAHMRKNKNLFRGFSWEIRKKRCALLRAFDQKRAPGGVGMEGPVLPIPMPR